MSTITGTFETAAGQPVKGRVGFTPDSPLYGVDEMVVQRTVWADLDASGTFTLTLDSTDSGNPSGWTYAVTEQFPEGRPVYHITLPEGSHRLEDLAPVPASAGTPLMARGPKGDTGPANVLSVGTVTTVANGAAADATITGTSPAQVLSLTLPRGEQGYSRYLVYTGTAYPARPYPAADPVTFVGSVDPSALMVNGDTWINTAPAGTAPAWTPYLDGSGSPEGVVAAQVGSRYIDRDGGALGALEWIKLSVAGAYGWRLSYADTGSRRVDQGQMLNGWVARQPWYLRRQGNLVTLQGGLNGSAATADVAFTLPAGFTFQAGSFTLPAVNGFWILRAGAFTVENTSRATANDFMLSWQTNDSWPAALPGVAG